MGGAKAREERDEEGERRGGRETVVVTRWLDWRKRVDTATFVCRTPTFSDTHPDIFCAMIGTAKLPEELSEL